MKSVFLPTLATNHTQILYKSVFFYHALYKYIFLVAFQILYKSYQFLHKSQPDVTYTNIRQHIVENATAMVSVCVKVEPKLGNILVQHRSVK